MSDKGKKDNVIQFPMDRTKKTDNVIDAAEKFVEKKASKQVKTLPESQKQTVAATAVVSNDTKKKDAFLQVEMDDGSWWEIPADLFAKMKAARASDALGSNVDIAADLSVYTKEYTEALTDDDTLIKWVEENIKWGDVSSKVRMVRPPDGSEYSKCWSSGMKRVVRR